MITKTQFSDLLHKFQSKTISDVEREQLLEAVANGAFSESLKENIFEQLHHPKSDGSWDREMEDALLAELLSVTRQTKQRSKIVPFIRIAAVAAVILLVAGISYIGFFSKKEPLPNNIARVISKKDVLPGKDGAILTLADGKQIVLDNAANGNLAIQGNAQVIKANGQITYNNGERGIAAVNAINTLTTPRGRQYEVTLPDGTAVWLNASSSITYPTAFNGKTREVSVTGEAYFEVAKNPGMPFHVKAGSMEVAVLGTHFNINSYSNETAIRTTLLEGSVRITVGAKISMLVPGQQAIVNKSDNAISVLNDVDTDLTTAWKNGFTSFKSADLKSIMRQVERWYDVDVRFEGNIPPRTFTGDVARNAPVSEIFKIFEESKIHYRIEDKTIIVTP
jgi:transmembrane sensor